MTRRKVVLVRGDLVLSGYAQDALIRIISIVKPPKPSARRLPIIKRATTPAVLTHSRSGSARSPCCCCCRHVRAWRRTSTRPAALPLRARPLPRGHRCEPFLTGCIPRSSGPPGALGLTIEIGRNDALSRNVGRGDAAAPDTMLAAVAARAALPHFTPTSVVGWPAVVTLRVALGASIERGASDRPTSDFHRSGSGLRYANCSAAFRRNAGTSLGRCCAPVSGIRRWPALPMRQRGAATRQPAPRQPAPRQPAPRQPGQGHVGLE